MTNKTRIAFIPIDNRPVCYSLPQQIAQINENLELIMPPIEYLGDLNKCADIEALYKWIEALEKVDYFVISLDTLAYGGLIPSRRSVEGFSEIRNRMDRFLSLFEEKKARVYAVSSIMRLSNNNINEEEKNYWETYGKAIFKYSYELDKYGVSESLVPPDILHDYMFTRKRNFDMNRRYLEWSVHEFLELLVFSKDDCAQFGLNVQESRKLTDVIEEKNYKALIKTGADEIPLTLLSRIVTAGKKIKIAPVFTNPDSKYLVSKYEDISVLESVKGQITLAGAEVSDREDADIILLVNNFKKVQGELVMDVDVPGYSGNLTLPAKPYIIADIVNANGADNEFMKKLIEENINNKNFLGYAGWNTTGNTLGSALCCGLVKYTADFYNEEAFKKVQIIRFLDDWAYQANLRKYLKNTCKKPDTDELKKVMLPFEKLLNKKFGTNYENISYGFPWNRFFEVEVKI